MVKDTVKEEGVESSKNQKKGEAKKYLGFPNGGRFK